MVSVFYLQFYKGQRDELGVRERGSRDEVTETERVGLSVGEGEECRDSEKYLKR